MSLNQKENDQQFIANKETEIKNEPQKKPAISPSLFEANQKSFSSMDSLNFNSKNIQGKEELKFFGVSEFYIKEISQDLISKYGNYFLKSFDKKNFI